MQKKSHQFIKLIAEKLEFEEETRRGEGGAEVLSLSLFNPLGI